MNKLKKRKLTSWQILSLGYLIVVLTGSFLLSLPFASKSGEWTPYIDSLFTAGSATCVTGLVVYDTLSHWSWFGQLVILLLIQIGGIGFMTMISMFNLILKRRIGVYERRILMQSTSNPRFSGTVLLVRRILIGTAIFELAGMVLLSIRFCQDMDFGTGLFYALFHSVSAFCNAGFDLMGTANGTASLMRYAADPLVNFTVMGLIVAGGIGFIVWNDFLDTRCNFKKMQLHTKVVLIMTAILIVIPALLLYLFEYDHAFKDMNAAQGLMAALFQSVSPRTAGFATVDLNEMSDAGITLMSVLMFVGGNTGSTAGGVKTTTIVVLLSSLLSSIHNTNDIYIGKRRIESQLVKQSAAIVAFHLMAIVCAVMIICAIEGLPLKEVAFETVSAISTVGLSLGITASLGIGSKLMLLFLMYAGRVGLLSLALALGERRKNPPINRPVDSVLVG